MTVSAKEAVREFYGQSAKASLWNSCSTGGRQGLMAAYRYPEDYDAVSAMAPANPMTDLMTQTMRAGSQVMASRAAAMSPANLLLVHKAAVAQCDAQDGLKDGLISQPNTCTFDPAVLQCKAGGGDCLSSEQVAAMEGIYGGVRDPKSGKQLLPGFPIGSEMQLAALLGGSEPFPVATTYFRMLVFANQSTWDWRTMDYATDMVRLRDFGAAILNVPSDGLKAFFARGGKLLLSHGWSDGLIPANNTLAFHHDLSRQLSPAEAEQSLRLFMAPGMDHCAGGEGPSAFDTLDVIDRWVSEGKAPERMVASLMPGPPGAPALPPMSRPLCRFPKLLSMTGRVILMMRQAFIVGRQDQNDLIDPWHARACGR
jgi:pimeloyl-ACP methyl ester carboxylesterase